MPESRAEIPWPTVAGVLVMSRLCEPSSELHIAEDFYRTTALEDILELPSELVNDDRLYRALDRLLPHKRAIEEHLQKRLGELFDLEYDLLLYDVTSTFFEGLAEGNPQAKRGHSRDHRPDCKQVCIALVVTREGVPLSYEVFDGNRVDVTTVEEIVGVMEKRFGLADRVWVMDRGMMSRKNIAWLQKTGRKYVLGGSRQEVKRWRQQIVDESGWQRVREGVEAKLARDGAETFVLCRSAERRQKEKAMHERFALRIEEGLGRLARRIHKARRKLDRGPLERQIGRLLQRNSRAAGRYLAILVDSARVGGPLPIQRGLLRAPHQRERLERRDPLADLRPTHPGRVCLPDPEDRAVHPPCLASEEGASPSPHLRLLPRLRPLEDPGAMADAGGSRQLSSDHPR
jgi:hypothetical protein